MIYECKMDFYIEFYMICHNKIMSSDEIREAWNRLIDLCTETTYRVRLKPEEDLLFKVYDGGDCFVVDVIMTSQNDNIAKCTLCNRIKVFPHSDILCIIGAGNEDGYLFINQLSNAISHGFRTVFPRTLDIWD